jgi:DNA-binding MarR family transcriptional regulator
MLRIRRHLTDLNYFREDAHIAAWQGQYDVDGRVFETLTNLWRGQAATPAELAEQVSEYRNYEEADYAAAFEELISLGWATKENGKFTITETGKATRQEAEDRTDEFFARPFAVLSEAETKELKDLLEKLAEALKPPEAQEESDK